MVLNMGRIANILDLPLDQKLVIVGSFLSIEFLLPLAVELSGKTSDVLLEENFQFAKNYLGTEVSHEKLNFLLKKFLDSCDLS